MNINVNELGTNKEFITEVREILNGKGLIVDYKITTKIINTFFEVLDLKNKYIKDKEVLGLNVKEYGGILAERDGILLDNHTIITMILPAISSVMNKYEEEKIKEKEDELKEKKFMKDYLKNNDKLLKSVYKDTCISSSIYSSNVLGSILNIIIDVFDDEKFKENPFEYASEKLIRYNIKVVDDKQFEFVIRVMIDNINVFIKNKEYITKLEEDLTEEELEFINRNPDINRELYLLDKKGSKLIPKIIGGNTTKEEFEEFNKISNSILDKFDLIPYYKSFARILSLHKMEENKLPNIIIDDMREMLNSVKHLEPIKTNIKDIPTYRGGFGLRRKVEPKDRYTNCKLSSKEMKEMFSIRDVVKENMAKNDEMKKEIEDFISKMDTYKLMEFRKISKKELNKRYSKDKEIFKNLNNLDIKLPYNTINPINTTMREDFRRKREQLMKDFHKDTNEICNLIKDFEASSIDRKNSFLDSLFNPKDDKIKCTESCNSSTTAKEQIKEKNIMIGDQVQFVTKDEKFYYKCIVNNLSERNIEFCCLNGNDTSYQHPIFNLDDILIISKVPRFQKNFSTRPINLDIPEYFIKRINDLQSGKYENSFLERYTCKCGKITGKMKENITCGLCSTKVKYVDDTSIYTTLNIKGINIGDKIKIFTELKVYDNCTLEGVFVDDDVIVVTDNTLPNTCYYGTMQIGIKGIKNLIKLS